MLPRVKILGGSVDRSSQWSRLGIIGGMSTKKRRESCNAVKRGDAGVHVLLELKVGIWACNKVWYDRASDKARDVFRREPASEAERDGILYDMLTLVWRSIR